MEQSLLNLPKSNGTQRPELSKDQVIQYAVERCDALEASDKKFRLIHRMFLLCYTDKNKTEEVAADFFFVVGGILRDEPLNKIKCVALNTEEVIEQLKDELLEAGYID